jgi:hypothetical protein
LKIIFFRISTIGNSKTNRRYANLTPWDGHMSTFIIAKDQTLQVAPEGIAFTEEMGINIAFIKKRRDNGENPYQK